jgi:hypothetical protein
LDFLKHYDLLSLFAAFVAGGLFVKLFEMLIALAKERREQRSIRTSQEKDRPRFRVDATEIKGSHPNIPTIRIVILSLGGLPLTINDGYVAIEPIEHPGAIQPQSLSRKANSPAAPVVAEFEVAGKYLHPMAITERYTVKLICKFSYADNQSYEDEQRYNQHTHKFEHLH